MKKVYLVLGILLILALFVIAFLYYSLAKPGYKKQEISKPNITEETIIEESHISYVLNELGAYNLHNPPLSSETPKINVKVDDDWYGAEVREGKIYTKKSAFDKADLVFYTSSEELKNALKGDIKEYMKSSVSDGKTSLELKASYSTLFSKGYLGLYQELTGKSLTGSIIRIFSQG